MQWGKTTTEDIIAIYAISGYFLILILAKIAVQNHILIKRTTSLVIRAIRKALQIFTR